jgi:hypothetical protein
MGNCSSINANHRAPFDAKEIENQQYSFFEQQKTLIDQIAPALDHNAQRNKKSGLSNFN